MRDLRYIIKRIIIGVGIVLVLSCLNACKVKASALTWDDMQPVAQVHSNSANLDFIVYYDSISNRYYYYSSNKPDDYTRYTKNADKLPYVFITWDFDNGKDFQCHLTNKPLYYSINDFNRIMYRTSPNDNNIQVMALDFLTRDSSPYHTGDVLNYEYHETFLERVTVWYNNNSDPWRSSNYNVYGLNDSSVLYHEATHNFLPGLNTSFNSWNFTKITNNNVITGYIFRPKFTNFNTNSYVYQYKVGKDSTRWLSFTKNEQQIKINNNVELYVRIKEKNSNNIIDSATFSITDIGSFVTEQDYNITFSGEYRTENYLNDNISSKSQSTIKEYQIYVDYIPKTSILKYQYQYVNDGDSLDNNNWKTLASSNNGSFTYVANKNGTLYARILDSSDNVLYTATFTVNNIGLLAIDSNENGVDNFFTKLSNKIGYGGPISNLFRIPIDILNKIYSYSSSTCSPYKISTLLGTDFVLPCYNFRETFGNTYYTLFDSLMCFVLSLYLFKFVRNIYDKFINMEDISS